MRRIIVLALGVLLLATPAMAAEAGGDWTEVTFTAFDNIDGSFEPHMEVAVSVFNSGKSIGFFIGQGSEIGPLVQWRVWEKAHKSTIFSIHLITSTDVSNAAEDGLWTNATVGIEPRFYWTEFLNAEIAIGLLSTEFQEGEKAELTPYLKVAFEL